MKPFIGRDLELAKLQALSHSGQASLAVIKGRRRVGKSCLVAELTKDKRFFSFSGLAPVDAVSGQDQRDAFARQLSAQLQLPPLTFLDWSDAFAHLTYHLTSEPTIILLDEISWMAAKDPTFVPKLKVWWDLNLQAYPQLILIFCGSVSTWIEKNIINSTAFFGRIALQIDLAPLSLPECAKFLKARGFKGSIYDRFKLLAVLGGIPWYLEQVTADEMADVTLKRLCFEKNGLLTLEFNRIFYDLFNGKGAIYRKIIHTLSEGMRTLADIRKTLNYAQSGSLSDMVQDLIVAGFVTQHYQWSLKTEHLAKQSLYRLSDCYTRFYMNYIEPELPKINQNSYQNLNIHQLPGWEGMMGYQVESLLLQNRPLLLEALGITAADIVADNPYLQRANARQSGCQIDYLIQTHTKNLFVCEFKFKRRELGREIIEQMQEKIKRFAAPRGFGVVPVLFHLGGVCDEVYAQKYFYRIIDITDFLGSEVG